jgi:hypothetical protein
MIRRWTCVLIWLVAATVLPAGTPPTVVWTDGKLGVDCRSVPLTEVLEEIARQVGMKLTGQADPDFRVTVRVAGAPLEKALSRIVKSGDFALRYPPGATTPSELLVSRPRGRGEAAPGEAAVEAEIRKLRAEQKRPAKKSRRKRR